MGYREKRWSNSIRLNGTKAFLSELEVGENSHPPIIIDQVFDGPNHLRGSAGV
jgi:hypothetical protein